MGFTFIINQFFTKMLKFNREKVIFSIVIHMQKGKFKLLSRVHANLLHLCLTLWDPVDYSRPGFSVHGILQARTLEWVAMPSSRGSSQPGERTQGLVLCLSHLLRCGRILYNYRHLGSPLTPYCIYKLTQNESQT